MATCISSTTKIHPKEWMHLWEMCKPLSINFFSRQKNDVPLCDSDNTGGWSAGPPESCCCWAQLHDTAVRAPVQRLQGWSSHPYQQLEALAQQVPNGMLEQHTQSGREQIFGTGGNETDSSGVILTCKMVLKGALEKKKPKPFKQRKEAESLELLSYFLLLQTLLAASFTGRRVQSGWAQCVPWQGPKTTGFSSDLSPQCAFRWPKGSLDPSASTMATDTFSHWPFYLVPAAWKYFKMATPQKSSPAAVDFEHEGKWKDTGCFTLSHTCRVCRGKAVFWEGQTGVLLIVHHIEDLRGW